MRAPGILGLAVFAAAAGGAIGTEVVVKAAPDGYTLLLSSAWPIVINQSLYPALGYDPLKTLVPITFIASSALVLVASGWPPTAPSRERRRNANFRHSSRPTRHAGRA